MHADQLRPRAEPALTDVYFSRRTNWRLVSPAGKRMRGMRPTDWRLKLDPENVGVGEGWAERGLPGETVAGEVPGVWNTTFPAYVGVAWYEAVSVPDLLYWGTVRLVIGGANYLTDAWLNGVYLGRHEGGYDAFSFRCTHALRKGENRVTLRIVDPPSDGEIDGLRLRECPTSKESWYGGAGGPWGGVWLEQSSRVWIEDVRVHGDLIHERAVFRVTLASDLHAAGPVVVRAELRGPGGSAQLGQAHIPISDSQPGGAVVELAVPVANPWPWSPESPTLYAWDVMIDAADAAHTDAVGGWLGFRTCEIRDGAFYLNGKPRFLKGVLLQPTYPRDILTTVGGDLHLEDVRLAKAAGCNLVRFHLRPPPPGYLEQCDTLGLLAYVEPPLAWIEPSERLLEHGRRELAALVRSCGNHPSVVLWGIFNENAKAAEAVGGELLAELARLDPTRPIVENSGGAAVGEAGMWAWGGQSRCWSPGWEEPRPLNDLHVYLASPVRRAARRLMTTLGAGPTLDVTPGRPAGERIASPLSPGAVLVSEYGCGALPDFDAALAAFGDEQHLADAVLLRELRDSLARGLAERGLDRVLGDVASLVRQTQAFQAEGIATQTAALRRSPRLAGVILTQLADAGWEQMAGLVGLWRHPRPALAAASRALRSRVLQLEADDPCGADHLCVRVTLVEEPGLPPLLGPAVLTVAVESEAAPGEPRLPPRSVSLRLPLPRAGTHAPPGWARVVTLPLPAQPGRYRVRARLTADGWADEASCAVRRLPDLAATAVAGLVLLGRGLQAALPEARRSPTPDWTGPILAHLPSRPAFGELARAVALARAGAHLCLVGLAPPLAARLEPLLGLPLRLSSGRGNFMGMHHYLREHPLFAGLGAPCLADATLAEALPDWVVEELPGADVLAGCFTVPDGGRGFLWRATVQTLACGRGRLTVYQLEAGRPLGAYLLDQLVGWLL